MSKQQQEELVTVTIQLPKQIAKYLQTFENEDLAQAITWDIIDHVRADVEGADPQTLLTALNLEPIFRKYKVHGYDKEAEEK